MENINLENLNGWAISEEILIWLINNIKPNSTILELGSGTGTIELCKFFNVYTIEHDEKWLNKAENANYIYAPIQKYKYKSRKYNWYDRDILVEQMPKDYEVIIIDGPPGKKIGRMGFYYNIQIFDTTKIIIVDDTNRDKDKHLSNFIAKWVKRPNVEYLSLNKKFDII